MKKYQSLYYLLFVLIVMGAFASMAQNNYGLNLLGIVAIIFSVVFILQFITLFNKKGTKNTISLVELAAMSLIGILFALRIFYIRFPFVEWIFVLAVAVLLFVYARKMIDQFRQRKQDNERLAAKILIFHLSLLLFLLALLSMPFMQPVAEVVGIIAFILLLVFVFIGFFSKPVFINGLHETPFSGVLKSRDHAVLLISLFFLFSLYSGLTKVSILPPIYSDEYPQGYFKMLNETPMANSNRDSLSQRSRDFKKRYDEFVTVNKIGEQ